MGAAVPLIAAVAGSAATSAGVFGATLLGSTMLAGLANSAIGFVVSTAVNQLGSRALAKKPKAAAFTAEATGRSVMIRSSVETHKIVYGRARVSGPLVYAGTSANATFQAGNSAANKFLHLVVLLASHEVEEIGDVYLNDQVVPLDGNGFASAPPYYKNGSGWALVRKHTGSATQAADVYMTHAAPGWTADHRLRGIAYLYVRLEWNPDIFPNGIPNVSAVVKGKKVYDPRTTLTAWSDNPALCVRDYLVNDCGVDTARVTDSYVAAAANACDESVTLADGTTQSRYTCNGVVDTGVARRDNLQALLTSMAGEVVRVGTGVRVFSGAYDSPAGSVTDDMLAGDVTVRGRTPRADLTNTVRGTYVDPDKGWQPTDFPPLTNATYVAQDAGVTYQKDLELPFTTHPEAAQRIAKLILEKARQGITVEMPLNHSALKFSTWDTVTYTQSHLGWSSKVFRIKSMKMDSVPTGVIRLTLQEESSASYDWSAGEAATTDAAPDTNLPNPLVVAPPQDVAAESGTDQLFVAGDGTVVSRIRVTWAASTNAFVLGGGRAEVQFKKSADTLWQDAAPGDATRTYCSPADDGAAYDVRVRFHTSLGVASAWTQISHTVVGKTEPPSDVTVFTIEGTRLTWTTVPDADVAGYRIRYQPGTTRSFGNAVPMHTGLLTASPFEMPVQPSGPVTIMIKAVDTSGNESTAAAYIVTDLGDPDVANVVETFDRKTSLWPGTLTNGTVNGSNDLEADSSTLMWNANSLANTWGEDSAALMWQPALYEEMTYEDRITVSAALSGSTMTIAAAVAGDPWSVQYRENSGNPMWSLDDTDPMWDADDGELFWDTPDWRPWPGEVVVNNSIYDFLVTTGQGATQGLVSAFTVTIDAPDIEETLNDVAVLAAGTRLPITKTYQVIRNVQLTVQADAGTAISARTDDKNATLGPLVKCLDAAGSATTGIIDARIKGY